MNNHLTNWKNHQCKDCANFIPHDTKQRLMIGALNEPPIGDCREGPPTPLIVGMQNNQPIISVMFVRLPENHPACSRFIQKTEAKNGLQNN